MFANTVLFLKWTIFLHPPSCFYADMQRNPVDDVLSKVIGEILKRNGFESVSKVAFNTITDLTKECTQHEENVIG